MAGNRPVDVFVPSVCPGHLRQQFIVAQGVPGLEIGRKLVLWLARLGRPFAPQLLGEDLIAQSDTG